MLFTSLSAPAGLPAFSSTLTPTPTVAPQPTADTRLNALVPTATVAVAPPPASAFVPVTIVPRFNCTTTGCVAADADTLGLFRAVQTLIELVAQRKGWNVNSTWWQATPRTGVIDGRTATNYLIIVNSGAPFGPLIDTKVDPILVARQAALFANTMAKWLGIAVPLPAPQQSILVQPPTMATETGTGVRLPQGGKPAALPIVTPPPPGSTSPSGTGPGPAAPPPPTEVPLPGGALKPPAAPDGTAEKPRPSSPAVVPPAVVPPAVVEVSPTMPGPRGKYRVGCVARFNRTRRIYSIYCPVTSALGYSYMENLAEQRLTPAAEPAPAGTAKEGEEATPSSCDTESGGVAPCPITADKERDRGFFRLHNPWMWLSLAGVVGVVGGTSYVVYRRRRGR